MKHRWAYSVLIAGIALAFWVPTLRDFWKEGKEPASPPAAQQSTTDDQSSPVTRPFEDYGIVSERGLFGASGEEDSVPKAEIVPESLPLAGQGLGLKLVGTVVADEPGASLAIIERQGVRAQEVYREGARAGQALIKKIARNQVVVNAGSGDVVLTMDFEGEAGASFAHASGSGSAVATVTAADSTMTPASTAHAEYAELIRQIRVRPYLEAGQPGGILVYGIEGGSVFAAMGLEDGDVIRGLNGEAISSPQQTVDLYRAVREGGALTLQVKRGDGNQELRFDGREAPPHPKQRGPTDRS
jgi:general secretion pathway protein C